MSDASLRTGRFTSSIVDVVVRPRLWTVASSNRPVILCHGAAETASSIMGVGGFGPAMRKLALDIASLGHVVVCPTITQLWGNSTSMTRIDNALTYARANGANNEDPILVGVSMGAGTALRWASNNPARSVAGIIPGVDFQQGRIDNPGGVIRGFIDAAWGVTYPAELPAGADPADLDYDVPIHLWYSTDDTTASATATEAFAAAKSAELTPLGNLNHTNAAIVAAIDDVIEFLVESQ